MRTAKLVLGRVLIGIAVVCLAAANVDRAVAQTALLSVSGGSGPPGTSVLVSVILAANGSTGAATVQWDLTYSTSDLSPASGVFYATGGVASAAGKSAICNIVSPGDVRCLVEGLNTAAMGSGVLATLTFQIAPATSDTSSPIFLMNVVASSGIGSSLAITASGGSVTINQMGSPVLSSLTCTPASVTPPATLSCTVSLSGPATGSATVSLSSASSSVTVPASVVIPSGSPSTNFLVSALTVSVNTTVVITATLNGNSQTFPISLTPAAITQLGVSFVTCNPSTLTGGSSTSCTIALLATAPQGGTPVNVSSSSSYAAPPAQVTVPAGLTSTGFTIATTNVTSVQIANISATSAGVTASFTLTIQPASTAITQPGVSFVTCNLSTLTGGSSTSCTITLLATAPQGGTPINVSSSSSYAAPPAQVTVPAGLTSTGFTVATTNVASLQIATISATSAGVTASFTLTIQPAPSNVTLSSLSCAPSVVAPGAASTCTVSLTADAPPSGVTVVLASSSGSAVIPASVVIESGSATATFTANAAQVSSNTMATLTASLNGLSVTFPLTVSAEPIVSALTNAASYAEPGCSPGSIATLFGTSFLNTGAQRAGVTPLPNELNGLRVQINGDYVPLFYAASEQVNFECPQLAPGTPISLVVESNTGSSPALASTVQFATPGIFSLDGSGTGQGAILIANSPNVAMMPVSGIPSQPATPGGLISIYGTGLGGTDVAVPPGSPAPVQPLAYATATVDASVGNQQAEVTFAGLAPGFAGLYQVNVQLPASVPLGASIPVQIAVQLPNGAIVNSNVVTIAIAAASN